jgi:hypothetical protein
MLFLRIPAAEHQQERPEAVVQRVMGLYKQESRRAFSLPEFCESPSVISGDASVSRMGVLRYVANKAGGVHWDSERGEWTDPISSRHRLLDENHLVIGWLTGAMYEVLSMAHVLISAQDTARLIERIEQVAPEEKRQENVASFREGRVGRYAEMTYGSNKKGG